MASFLMSMWMNVVLNSLTKSSHLPKLGGESARAFFVTVEAQVAADPSFIKDRAKAIFFGSVS